MSDLAGVGRGPDAGEFRLVDRTRRRRTVTEEFTIAATGEDLPARAETVFERDDATVVRVHREADGDCPCDRIEDIGCPVADVWAEDGALLVRFRPRNRTELRAVIDGLREAYDGVSLEHLVRTGDPLDQDGVVVDRGQLTARQREVLETAHEMGYFDYPKGANAGEVADRLGVNPSTFQEHLSAAQTKLLGSILAE